MRQKYDKVKQECPVCKKQITVTRGGRGVFRRHSLSKGVICDGSWCMPGVVCGRKTAVARAHVGDPCRKCGVNHDDVAVGDCPRGSLCSR